MEQETNIEPTQLQQPKNGSKGIKYALWGSGGCLTLVLLMITVIFVIGMSALNKTKQEKPRAPLNQGNPETSTISKPEEQKQDSQQEKNQNEPQEVKQDELKQEQMPIATESPIKRIETLIAKTTPDSEVTIWDTKQNFAKDTTPPPYEVIVNAGNGVIADCDSAKRVSFYIMKDLYSDASIKDKISRIIFTSWGKLRISLGSEDGTKMDWGPLAAGPTTFWQTMMKYKPYEEEKGPLSQRTWGKFIGSDCK